MSDQEKQEPPSHLATSSVVSQGYKYYLDYLKKGGKSGISHLFGSAAALLSDSPEPALPAPSHLDVSNLEPETESTYKLRFALFTKMVSKSCRDFLTSYIANCRHGAFGADLKEAMPADISERAIDSAVKYLTCTTIHLTATEQVDTQSSPDWLQQFMYLSLTVSDQLLPEPPLLQVMKQFGADPQIICRTVSNSVCKVLGFGKSGDASWNAVNIYLRAAGEARHNILKESLTTPV